ncbi:DUF5655 domain-containing protein [Aliikangiella sp. IMCC44653]
MDKALQTMIENMPEKTGKSLAQWKTLLSKNNFEKHSQAVNYLKSEYGITHGFANTIVSLYKADNEPEIDLVKSQYLNKEQLLPIYDALIKYAKSLGSDVVAVPKKASVSIKTSKQFALIKPATKTRIDLGLKLKDVEAKDRLGPSGPFGAMCTHRVQLTTVDDVDQEVKQWLKLAYDNSH